MKYEALLKKMQIKGNQLAKTKQTLAPLKVTLTQKSFNELQEDIVINHKELPVDQQLEERDGLFHIKSPSSAIPAEITIEN